ncbi:MAG: EamA family transporter [Candidatus Woesearchaeota archaeon]|nr:MAG: EamA family transporter [Candidatus Woesearchaeota archaeon]
MSWVIYPIAVAFIWAIIDIIDKHVIDGELKDPLVCTTISGFVLFLLFSIIAVVKGAVFTVPNLARVILILAGAIYAIAVIFYYSAFQKERVSILVPLFPLRALFVTLISFLVLGEKLTFLQYLGIVVLVIGAILIAYKKGVKYKLTFPVLLILVSVFFRSIRDIFVKFSSGLGVYDVFNLLFWVFYGYFIVAGVIFIFHHPFIMSKYKKGAEHIVLNNFLAFANLSIYFYAISKHSVSLIVALASISPLIVFFLVFTITKLRPSIICEKFNREELMLYLSATVLVVVGAILILI